MPTWPTTQKDGQSRRLTLQPAPRINGVPFIKSSETSHQQTGLTCARMCFKKLS
jgi:hypothetical protein